MFLSYSKEICTLIEEGLKIHLKLTHKIQKQLFQNDLPEITKMPNSQKVIINKHILETFVKTIMEELEAQHADHVLRGR